MCMLSTSLLISCWTQLARWEAINTMLLQFNKLLPLYTALWILLTNANTVRPALSRHFWSQEDKINTASSSYIRPSKPGSIPISDNGHDAFDMAKMKRQTHNNYKVTISTRTIHKDSDSTERIMDGAIMVDTHVDVHSDIATRV